MESKKRILTGIGVLAFVALLALNVHLVNTTRVQQKGFASLSLLELEVQAQSEGEGGGGCSATATCYIMNPDPPYEPEPYGSVSCTGTSSCTTHYERVVCDRQEQICGQ